MIRLVVNLLIDPLNHLLLILLAGAFFYWRGRSKAGRFCLWYSVCWLLLISVSPLPSWLSAHWERSYPVLTQERFPPADSSGLNIVVLGAGHSVNPTFPPNDQLSENALPRIVEGVRLYRQLPFSKLICSGYSSTARLSQATVLANTAVVLGVTPSDTLQMPEPYNTEAEARTYSERFGCERPLVLVTSAVHMPRAMFWFRYYGCDPIPAPTNHLIKPDPDYPPFPFKPSIRKMEMTKKLLHEYVGMIYAHWKGKRR